MPTYKQVQENQTSSRHVQFLVGALLCAATIAPASRPAAAQAADMAQVEAAPRDIHDNNVEGIVTRIHDVSENEALRDEDERAPAQEVIEQAIQLVRDAGARTEVPMPFGQVATFFGEINVTWRAGDRIVRLACFPDRPSLIQTGSLTGPIGSYESEPNPTAQRLAEAIDALFPQHDPEEAIFG